MEQKKTLEDLVVGDKVLVHNGSFNDTIETITKITNTQIVVKDNRYNKTDGHKRGANPWFNYSISIPTQEDIDRIAEQDRRSRILYTINKFYFASLSTDNLEIIYKMIKESKENVSNT